MPQDDEDAAKVIEREREAYRQHFDAIIAGNTGLPPSTWLFCLLSGLTMMVCYSSSGSTTFDELRVRPADRPQDPRTSHIGFIRWLDRLQQPGNRHYAEVRELMQKADPMAEAFGCERVVWSRKDELFAETHLQWLSKRVTESARDSKRKLHAGLGTKRKQALITPDVAVVNNIRAALDGFGKVRLRADDAYRDFAHCDVVATGLSATPVRVLPVLGTERENQWRPVPRDTWAVKQFRQYEISQGYKLSSYYQFRMDLLAVPRGYEAN